MSDADDAAKWRRISFEWEAYCREGAGSFDWDYDSRDTMRELTGQVAFQWTRGPADEGAVSAPAKALPATLDWRLERLDNFNYQLAITCDEHLSVRGQLGEPPKALSAGDHLVIPIPSAGLEDLIRSVEQAPIEMAWNTKQPAKLASWLKGYGAGRAGAAAALRKHRAKVPE